MVAEAIQAEDMGLDNPALRSALERAKIGAGSVGPVLAALVGDGGPLITDEIVARVKGALIHLAKQLTGDGGGATGSDPATEQLRKRLSSHHGLLAHIHSLALETHLTERLRLQLALDPVLSPLMQMTTTSNDAVLNARGMALLAAQARFVQHQRRMELPLDELPAELLDLVLSFARNGRTITAEREAEIRQKYDEGRTRLALLSRFVVVDRARGDATLQIERAGVAVFLTALALASGQDRVAVCAAASNDEIVALALSLRAAGVNQTAIETQLSAIHPGACLPTIGELDVNLAMEMMALPSVAPGN